MSRAPEDLAAEVLDAAKAAGAAAADALIVEDTGTSMEMRNGALEQAERAEGIEIGLRVLMGQKQACVAISDQRAEAIAEMA
ncbi:MAG: DNA gyrase modulator, partial [Pseudomonadota bacterium]